MVLCPSCVCWKNIVMALRLIQSISCNVPNRKNSLKRGKQKILYLLLIPGVTKLTLMLFIGGNNWANLLVLLK